MSVTLPLNVAIVASLAFSRTSHALGLHVLKPKQKDSGGVALATIVWEAVSFFFEGHNPSQCPPVTHVCVSMETPPRNNRLLFHDCTLNSSLEQSGHVGDRLFWVLSFSKNRKVTFTGRERDRL